MIIGIAFIFVGIMMFVFPVKSEKKDAELTVEDRRRIKLTKKLIRVCAVVVACCGIINMIISVIE